MSSDADPRHRPVDLDLPDAQHHPHGDAHDPLHDEVESHVDPVVAEAVHSVRDRFGAHGLRDLIALAGYELELVEQALLTLREVDHAPASAPDADLGSRRSAEPHADGGTGSR